MGYAILTRFVVGSMYIPNLKVPEYDKKYKQVHINMLLVLAI